MLSFENCCFFFLPLSLKSLRIQPWKKASESEAAQKKFIFHVIWDSRCIVLSQVKLHHPLKKPLLLLLLIVVKGLCEAAFHKYVIKKTWHMAAQALTEEASCH